MRKALFDSRLLNDTYAQRFRRALKISGHSGTSEFPLDAFAPAPDGFTFHVWITLEIGAIFDPTILATITAENPTLYRPGATVFGSPETALPQHAYVPLLVGQDLIERLLAESTVPVAILQQCHASEHAHHSNPGA